MSKPYARNKALSEAYALLRHPVWAWLQVYGDDRGGWRPPRSRKKKAMGNRRAADSDTEAETDVAVTEPLSFAEIESQAYRAFAEKDMRAHLDGMKLPPPEPPGSGTLAALLADLETVRLGALRAGDWREARAAVMDKAKLCATTLRTAQEKDMPPDDRPLDVIVDEALETLGAWRDRRDAITAAVQADRERDRSRGNGAAAIPPLRPATPLP